MATIWYEGQLSITEPKFLLFVPDSPTASLFFTISIICMVVKEELEANRSTSS